MTLMKRNSCSEKDSFERKGKSTSNANGLKRLVERVKAVEAREHPNICCLDDNMKKM